VASSALSLFDYGFSRLKSLSSGVQLAAAQQHTLLSVYERLTSEWARIPLQTTPPWPSQVCDDHSPIEFSLGITATPEVRILVEPMGSPPNLASNTEKTRLLIEALAAENPSTVDLTRMWKIWDLFVPKDPQGSFTVWVSAVLAQNQPPAYKLYFNPNVRGAGGHTPRELVREALERLGFRETWFHLQETLLRRGPEQDVLNYFSLDLSASLGGRVKVYAFHRQATPETFDQAAKAATSYRPGDAERFFKLVAPDTRLDRQPPSTCLSLVEGQERPTSATLHFPIAAYAPDEDAIRARILNALKAYELPSEVYERALGALAGEASLNKAAGTHSYVSFRRDKDKPRLSVYLPIRAYLPQQR